MKKIFALLILASTPLLAHDEPVKAEKPATPVEAVQPEAQELPKAS